MNICNPSLVINVAGVQNLLTGLWFGKLAQTPLVGGDTPSPVAFVDAGTTVGGGWISIANNQIVFNAAGIVDIVVWAQLEDPTYVYASLGIQLAADVPGKLMHAAAPFVQGFATSVYKGQVQAGDVIMIVGESSDPNETILTGTVAVRFDGIS
jgi:hypothetical protein